MLLNHIFFENRGGGVLDPLPPPPSGFEHAYPEGAGVSRPLDFRGIRENRSSGFPTRSDTNRAVQSKKLGRGLKFWI